MSAFRRIASIMAGSQSVPANSATLSYPIRLANHFVPNSVVLHSFDPSTRPLRESINALVLRD